MASGHVNRTNRPNTWLHRPATRREDSPCQLGAVHTWHIADQSQSPEFTVGIDAKRTFVDERSRPILQRMTQSGSRFACGATMMREIPASDAGRAHHERNDTLRT